MRGELAGCMIAILAGDGVEQAELVEPRRAVTDAGARVELLSITSGEIQAVNKDINPADRFLVDRPVARATGDDYDALVLPGGAVNPDNLRMYPGALEFVRGFAGGKVVDEEVVTDRGLVSSRGPQDLRAFCTKIIEEFAEGTHATRAAGATAR